MEISQIEVPQILLPFLERPPLYAKGDSQFWDHPHISKGMLAAHFDTSNDLASYRPERRRSICDWIAKETKLPSGAQVLDLGCGPGHYAVLWAKLNCEVTGIDINPRSIATAKEIAAEERLGITYLQGDYCNMDLGGPFDLVTMVSCDFGVLLPIARVNLAAKIASSLGTGSTFAFDVLSEAHAQELDLTPRLEVFDQGFWHPSPHLVLSQTWFYEEQQCKLNQFVVLSDEDQIRIIRRWEQLFSVETVTRELAASGFTVVEIRGDLAGQTDTETSSTLGILAKPESQTEVLTFSRN